MEDNAAVWRESRFNPGTNLLAGAADIVIEGRESRLNPGTTLLAGAAEIVLAGIKDSSSPSRESLVM